MSAEKRFMLKRGILLLLVGLSVFLLYLYFFVGITEILSALQRADPLYYLLAALSLLLSTAFYSLTWQRLLSLLSIKTAFRRTFLFVWVGAFVDLLVPAESVSGDISRAYLMFKSSGENAGKVVASVISHRIISMAVTLSGLVIGSGLFLLKYEPSELVVDFIIVVTTCTVVALFLLFYLSLKEQATRKIVNWIIGLIARIFRGRWQTTRIKSKAQKMLTAFHEGIQTLGKSPRSLASPVVFSIVAWIFDLLIAYLVFISLEPDSFRFSLSAILIVYSVSNAVQAIPLGIPAEVGLTEIIMTSLYVLLGIPPVISAAATVLIRVLTVWFRLFIGYVAVELVGIKVLTSG